MKILPINTINLQQSQKVNNSEQQKANVLPKAVEVKQNFSSPTFKSCGVQQAAALAGCSTFGIT